MCDKKNHPLIEVFRSGGGEYNDAVVVNWCPDCGAVVVDSEYDGRINPGRYMEMRFPKETLKRE